MASYKDCIIAAAEFLRLDDIATALKNSAEENLSESDKADLGLLLSCTGFVVSEIAAEYIPLVCVEAVEVKGGKIPFSALKNGLTDVVCVKVGGVKKPFSALHGEIVLRGAAHGIAEVTYCRTPAPVTEDGETEWGERVSARLIGYGVACEYCIISGMSEATLWDKRYKDALAAAKRTKSELRVKKRSWI